MIVNKQTTILWIVGIFLLFPLFFQISGGVYNSLVPVIDSGGVLAKLPLPVSIFACFFGGLALIGNYRRAYWALLFISALLLLMLVSSIFADMNSGIKYQKIIMILQVMLPIFGLFLGQLIVDNNKIVPTAFLIVLIIIVPFQLLASFANGSLTLTHHLYFFSIYQHFQYVPLIFVCAYGYSMVELWDSRRKLLLILSPLMFVYSIASVSFLTVFAFMLFLTVFTYSKLRINHNRLFATVASVLGLLALLVCMYAYFTISKNNSNVGVVEVNSKPVVLDGGQYVGKFKALENGKTPANVEERFEIWKLYGTHVSESTGALLLGHGAPLPREIRSSAHNWYLDMVYNFGLLSLLPMMWLIFFTIFMCWKYRESLPTETLWLAGIVFYLVIIDSNLKVTLRQPYPGIFSYFLWGVLLSKLIPKWEESKLKL